MYLKSLDIRGFKSFADTTHIDFRPGINVIVGPNGCGKSNLVDAVRWVLGEQNIRNLRGQKLEDVIFTGSDQKKALSMASVTITLDNSDQVLPVPFTEVSVNRRVYRSEQSEFSINQNQVRLKDITQLFSGTGLGRKGYAIIGQGEIENLLSARPQDIRLMLEEASGLIRFRYQKEEAQERLDSTARDLDRVSDIMNEVKSRLEELKVKSERATVFNRLSQELEEVRTALLTSEWNAIRNEIERERQQLAELTTLEAGLQQELDSLEQESRKGEAILGGKRQELDALRTAKYTALTRLSQIESEINHTRERLQDIQQRVAEIEQEKKGLSERLTALEVDIDGGRKRLRDEENGLKGQREELERLRGEWLALVGDQRQAIAELENLKTALVAQAQEAARLRNTGKQLEEELKSFSERDTHLGLEMEQRAEACRAAEERARQLGEDYRETQSLKEELVTRLAARESLAEEARSQRMHLENELQQCQRELVQAGHQLQSLEAIQNSYSGFAESIRSLIAKQKKSPGLMPGFLGVVADLIQVPPGLETAIEVALGRGMENLVVASEADARAGVAFLKQNRLGRATFLPLDLLRSEPVSAALRKKLAAAPGVIGLASDLITFEARIAPAIEYLLGRVVVVDSLDTGVRLHRQGEISLRLVTLEGEVMSPQGAITGGSRKVDNSPLKRQNELMRLRKEIADLSSREEEMKQRMPELAEREKNAQEELEVLRRQIQEADYRLQMQEEEIGRALNLVKTQQDRLEEIGWQRRLLEQEATRKQEMLQSLTMSLQAAAQEEARLQAELEHCKESSDHLLRRMEVGQERINSLEQLVGAREREVLSLQRSQQQLESLRASYRDDLGQQEEKRRALMTEQGQREEALVRLIAEGRELETGNQKTLEQENELQEEIARQAEEMTSLGSRLAAARVEISRLQERKRQLELRLARQETEFTLYDQQLAEEAKREPGQPLGERALRELRAREARLRVQIEELGPVDPGSIEEFRLTGERYSFLSTQQQDLVQARASLVKLVGDTEKVMGDRFLEFLGKANQSFAQTFVDIFGGGEATLNQVGDEGVEIMVKMPGKKRQALNMLSGGERSLTCIALLFSLLRLKPVPFCMLDEVDAALDEINLQRFASFLRRLAADIQFVIISHRQGTIEIAHTLYGVTMPEGGISTILSLEVEPPKTMAG